MLMDYLSNIPDHRRGQGRRYDLAGIIFCTILAVLSGADSYRRIQLFMNVHFRSLQRDLGLSWRRAPSRGQLRDILAAMPVEPLEAAFRGYSASLAEGLPHGNAALACDGKALRGSFDHLHDRKVAQLLSVFATGSQLILAHREIPDKTNEIPAFQQLVKELGLTGKLFTLDALHTQKNGRGSQGQRQRRAGASQGKPEAVAG
jgi:DDE_Tnp_1-associated